MTADLTARGYPRDAWSLLAPQLSPNRRERMEAVARERTKHLRLVIQDVHDPHNVAACMRSAEAFGILHCDVINLGEPVRKSSAHRGTSSWLNVKRWKEIEECAVMLKAEGYQIAAGFPEQDCHRLDTLPLDRPIAVLFGNEHDGVSPAWLPHIDIRFTIPMVGMVESLNISVAAALTIYTLRQRGEREIGRESFCLSERERHDLLCDWICQQIPSYQGQLALLRRR